MKMRSKLRLPDNIHLDTILLALFFLGAVPILSAQELTSQDCLDCHGEEGLTREGPAGTVQSLTVEGPSFEESVHGVFSCVDCHAGIEEIPHESELPSVSCGDCHDAQEAVDGSVHGSAAARDVVSCVSCHGNAHAIFSPADRRSNVYPLNVYRTCGSCHFEEEPPIAGEASPLSFERYIDDIHGRGVIKAGLIVSATCVSCHGSHEILRHDDPDSRVSRQHVVTTCGTCHVGNARDFADGAHGQALAAGSEEAPVCVTCHQPHQIQMVEGEQSLAINRTCAECHDSRAKSFSQTYHGKVTALGYGEVATCNTCHLAHLTLPLSDPRSSIHPDNRVATCAGCHPGANENFAGYLVHADMDHLEAYPVLHWASVGMTALLISVFTFFGLHSLLWLRRSLQERNSAPPGSLSESSKSDKSYFQRLTYFQRAMHGVVIVSFLGLAITGLPLKFSETHWAGWLIALLGGFRTASTLHRVFAVATFGYFITHLVHITHRVVVKGEGNLLWGPDSMVPQPKDFSDLYGTFLWFFGKGPKPRFDRWAYWEKFDYWAVFWGMGIIGGSGLVMAFPTFFTQFLPGAAINLALIIHSDEALLATGFIFAIHFFNTHLKPEKYPMDMTFYTGSTALEEYEREHPLEVERLRAAGRLDERLVGPPPDEAISRARRYGFTAVAIGLMLLVLIIGAIVLY
jgi:cytochrome b subunit of formate dehydrogenase